LVLPPVGQSSAGIAKTKAGLEEVLVVLFINVEVSLASNHNMQPETEVGTKVVNVSAVL
jgi:hypothetical protein